MYYERHHHRHPLNHYHLHLLHKFLLTLCLHRHHHLKYHLHLHHQLLQMLPNDLHHLHRFLNQLLLAQLMHQYQEFPNNLLNLLAVHHRHHQVFLHHYLRRRHLQ